jgi:hypothetical protein
MATSTLAYYDKNKTTAVKRFMIQVLEEFLRTRGVEWNRRIDLLVLPRLGPTTAMENGISPNDISQNDTLPNDIS